MSEKQTSQPTGIDPTLQNFQGEISLAQEITDLKQNSAIDCEDLFSSNKMRSQEYPDRPGVGVELHTPIETAVNINSDVQQDLMAVVALGKDVALGIVRGRDTSGEEVNYISLLNNSRSDNNGRARFVDTLKPGTPIVISRSGIAQVVGRDGSTPSVSGKHCSIELKGGVLTVVDETSTNGTSVFTNATRERTHQFAEIQIWSQPSTETKKLIESEKESKRLLTTSKLGRFALDDH